MTSQRKPADARRKQGEARRKSGEGRRKTGDARGAARGGHEEAPLSDYLAENALVDKPVGSKEELLRALSRLVVQNASGEVADRIYEAVQEREASFNTYVGGGVAIPHARVDCVDSLAIAIARSRAGIPYGIVTDEPVRVAVLVVGPDDLRDEHVRVLGAVARLMQDPERREEILNAPDIVALRKLLGASGKEAPRRKPSQLSQVLLGNALKIKRELGVTAILLSTENRDEVATLKKGAGSRSFIVATSSRGLFEDNESTGRGAVLLPSVPLRREARMRLAALMALTYGLIQRGDVITIISGDGVAGLDSLTVMDTGREFGRFVTPSGNVLRGVAPAVLDRVLTLSTELAQQGREGKPVGTIFVIGDPQRLASFCQQMVMNPFRGYAEEQRNILDPTLAETIKEFAAIDGAFVLRGDGVVVSAGTFLRVSGEVSLPGGYGSRHRVACAITDASCALSVAVSQSSGEVSVFKNGEVMLSLPRAT